MKTLAGLLALATALSGCSSTPSVSSRAVDVGDGIRASLDANGVLSVTQSGRTLLATAPGVPLFSRQVDAANPTAFHDPRQLQDVTFARLDDASIDLESPAAGVLHLTVSGDQADTVLVSLALASDDGFYTGLGERYDHVDPRGQIVGMQLELDGDYESGTTDRHVPVPWLVSSRGYGVFVKDRQAGAWDVGATDPGVVRATFEGTTLDVTVVFDPDPLAVVAAFARMTGLPRRSPTWALSPMMWRHADSQAEVLSDLATIRSLHIPTSTFWIDDGWQTAFDTCDFDPAKFPDPTGFALSMQRLGFELFGWNSPYLPSRGATGDAQALYEEGLGKGWFIDESDGTPFLAPGPSSKLGLALVDFSNPAARAFWAAVARKPVLIGMNGFKLDYGEDMVPDLFGGRLGLKWFDGESERTARNYPLGYHGAYRAALAATSDGGVLVVRASTYGGASVADIVWPGDLDNGFEHYGDPDPSGSSSHLVGGLPASIVAGQTLAASGFPLYGADTGGYRHGAPTKEALLRWAGHTALSMVMQLGPGEDKYPWNYDADTVSTYAALASLHQKLVPYLASLLANAESDGTPTLRPLPLAFPGDLGASAAADDEYMLGPALLAAPVVVAGATSRSVYLPPGAWFSWWDGSRTDGPTTVQVPAPLGQPPLFARAGALVPLLPDGIDTLVAATDPSTVSLAARAGYAEASGWVSGNASAAYLDGSTLSITDDASGVEVAWAPAGTGRVVTASLDLEARTGKTSPLATVKVISGGSANSYTLAGDRAVLHFEGASDVRIE